MLFPIPEGLTPSDKNKINSFLPIRNKGNEFKWDTITGLVLGHVLKKVVKNYSLDQFREACQARFIAKLDEPGFWPVLDRMYFATEAVFHISPLFLLFKSQQKGSGKSELGAENLRMAELFAGLLGNTFLFDDIPDNLNFIEQEMLNVLRSELKAGSVLQSQEQPYLPYLAAHFQDDITFLACHPQYMLQELTNMLQLYAFSYCAQLALHVTDWKAGIPASKPLYFILDNEKASKERVAVQYYGHKLFSESSKRLFPMLSALEVLQIQSPKRPLWQVYRDALAYHDQPRLLAELNRYLHDFAESRTLQPYWCEAQNTEQAFDLLRELAIRQFESEKDTRSEINNKYVKELEKQVGANFIQSRGRAGRVLVLNQDQLLLLTNLAIGQRDKLRLHELIKGFEQRGFYLDSQSQQVLVSFYERMGNVERMSDSGDAVYVRKTL
ncbi:DNA phosphorothioation-dependent restriction protein DptG [Pseudaeromonas paramecii]|uniref:DNA phosphorothioation-dependent restriction protein DptG n=1 Tax=Pseudaeromonas paramecii TaxID=2138166 RepID=A0ABP8PWB7_9GAMM